MTDEQNNQTDLKPCPFCGGEQVYISQEHVAPGEIWWVRHKGCYGSLAHGTEAEAITAWNTRAISERERALVEAVRALSENIGAASLARNKYGIELREKTRAALAAYGDEK